MKPDGNRRRYFYTAQRDPCLTLKRLSPDVTTDAKRINNRETPISEEVASPFQTTTGAGVDSLRQRVKGDGGDGFHKLESTGASEIGTIGDGDGDGEGEGTGSGDSNNPFAKALKRIADHIIGTREVDKVNVVFVLDTSASMRDNVQEVAANLFAMVDAFDLVNLEYHFGMSEFSVRYEGQKLEIRTLLPDVGMLRRRMQKPHSAAMNMRSTHSWIHPTVSTSTPMRTNTSSS